MRSRKTGMPYLAILQSEDQRDLVAVDILAGDLGGDPALSRVGLPGLGADIVGVRHGDGGVGGAGCCVRCGGGVLLPLLSPSSPALLVPPAKQDTRSVTGMRGRGGVDMAGGLGTA